MEHKEQVTTIEELEEKCTGFAERFSKRTLPAILELAKHKERLGMIVYINFNVL